MLDVRNQPHITYDGNGNITEYLNAAGAVEARFSYDAFGNTLIDTDVGHRFQHRFSTKRRDLETGLYYCGYRYYDPVTGRWPSRDPIGEDGGLNLYRFVENNPPNDWDYLGKQIGMPGGGVQGDTGTGTHAAMGIGICKLLEFKIKQKLGMKPNDKRFHCVTSCSLAQAGGDKLATALGNLKECYTGQGNAADSAQDQAANAAGRACASAKDCKCCCAEAGY